MHFSCHGFQVLARTAATAGFIALALCLGSCAPKAKETPEAAILHTYLEAFNRHDPSAVAALLSPNVKWLNVDTDKLSVEGDGRDAVRNWLTGYFKSQPDVRSEFLSLEQTGILVAARERVTWTAAGTRHSQQSHAVYQVRNGLITHVWHFPAVRAP